MLNLAHSTEHSLLFSVGLRETSVRPATIFLEGVPQFVTMLNGLLPLIVRACLYPLATIFAEIELFSGELLVRKTL